MADITVECNKCKGTGEVWRDQGAFGNDCGHCAGSGKLSISNMVEIDDILTKLDALDTKMDTLDTHLDTIETKIEAL